MRFNYYIMILLAAAICTNVATIDAQEVVTAAEEMPQQWQYSEGFDQMSPVSDKWWNEFDDRVLDSVINMAVNNNYNVLTAKKRIEMASQQIRQAQSQYYPTLVLSAGWNGIRQSGMTGKVAMDATNMSYFDMGLSVNWQIDIFGKITARANESKAAFNATKAQYDAMMVTIAAKTATAYFQLRTLQAERAVLQEHIAQQKRVSDITQARHEAGLASMLDVTQALTTYYSTQATIHTIESSITTTINSIATLLGVYPQEIYAYLEKERPMPDYHQIVAVGIPADLLRRRPDVAEAEYTLAQYAAAVGIAKKDFLPTLSLSGSIGTSAHKIDKMFDDRSINYSIAPTLSWTIFDGMSRNAALESAKAQMQTGIYNYNQTVLTAVQETENAMASYYNDLQYIDQLNEVVEQAQKSFELSIDLYKQGLTDFINVSNAQINYLQYSDELISAQGQALIALVNLYEALGGGWENQ